MADSPKRIILTFDEMIFLRLKELDYDQKKKVFEFIETLRTARREAREG
jgi:hypothetical protein